MMIVAGDSAEMILERPGVRRETRSEVISGVRVRSVSFFPYFCEIARAEASFSHSEA